MTKMCNDLQPKILEMTTYVPSMYVEYIDKSVGSRGGSSLLSVVAQESRSLMMS